MPPAIDASRHAAVVRQPFDRPVEYGEHQRAFRADRLMHGAILFQ
jgi:hypothetical protein